MATKTVNTRIKNKVDSYSVWKSSTAPLLDGEIALVRVPTGETYTNPVTGASEPKVALLMKVGNGTDSFENLPWMSAKASDVYDWAKGKNAEDVTISIKKGNDGTETEGTLGSWLKTAYDAGVTNASSISAVSAKVDVDKVSTAISAAIEALDSEVTGSGDFVTAVVQENGKVKVTKKALTVDDIPTLPTSKIEVSEGVTLAKKLEDVDAAVADLDERLSQTVPNDDDINGLIDAKINALDVTDSAVAGQFVTAVSETDGKISVSREALPTASATAAGIVKLGAAGGAATFETVDGISADVADIKNDITDINNAIAGGVHFIGEVAAAPEGASVTVNGKAHTAAAGDVVIFGEKEYIYTGTAWKELGDLSRVGAVETAIEAMDYNGGDFGTSKFVTEVTQENGKVSAKYAQPASTDIKHGTSSTVDAALSAIDAKLDGVTKVTDSINGAINDLTHTVSGSGDYVTGVTQSAGKVTVTKGSLPTASTSASGIVKLNDTTSSTSTTEAATANAVKSAYDLANTASTNASDAQTRVAAVEGEYVRFNTTDKTLHVGKDSVDVIIFDCGTASDFIE